MYASIILKALHAGITTNEAFDSWGIPFLISFCYFIDGNPIEIATVAKIAKPAYSSGMSRFDTCTHTNRLLFHFFFYFQKWPPTTLEFPSTIYMYIGTLELTEQHTMTQTITPPQKWLVSQERTKIHYRLHPLILISKIRWTVFICLCMISDFSSDTIWNYQYYIFFFSIFIENCVWVFIGKFIPTFYGIF